jgi:hypothetical protein
MRVCDDCLTAAYDEGASGHDEQANVCRMMGADLADHVCEARDEPDTGPCACDCNDGGDPLVLSPQRPTYKKPPKVTQAALWNS